MSVVRLARFIRVRGVVQGVGFRPFVYGLATGLGLTGWVRNTSSGVEIALEGPAEALARFRQCLEAEAPPLARIEGIVVEERSLNGYQGFEIRQSHAESGQYQLVSPDISICEDCRRELFDPQDRRYRYPFINCTNCGPRFTIIHDVPYDRTSTTMARFMMCPACQAEYADPRNRRFHAQPNACPACGPQVVLATHEGETLAEREEAIQAARRALAEGRIVALKGLGGFHLACDATSGEAVAVLRRRKQRPDKPLAVMVADLAAAARLGSVSPAEAALLRSPERPIVLLAARSDSPLAPNIAPGTGTVGVMLPYTPLHYLLLEPAAGFPAALVMTSGNLSEEPIAMENDEALGRLGQIADLFLLHDRGIYARYDDSVWFVPDGRPQPARRARGYAPFPVRLPFRAPEVLACGPELKNTFCFTREEYAFLSPHIGDLENLETLEHFERSIALYRRLFRLEPRLVAYDLHPEYLASKFARERWGADPQVTLVPVQHHHAHIAACLVDNGRCGPAIGVALDGTGYGTDGHIWGGEFLLADLRGFRRLGHLAEFPLPGGAAAIRRPYRTALGLLLTACLDPAAWPALRGLDPQEVESVRRQVASGLNTPLTSSAGRLFDAVAALIGVRGDTTYEAQAAMELEALAARAPGAEAPYPSALQCGGVSVPSPSEGLALPTFPQEGTNGLAGRRATGVPSPPPPLPLGAAVSPEAAKHVRPAAGEGGLHASEALEGHRPHPRPSPCEGGGGAPGPGAAAWTIDWRPMLMALLADVRAGVAPPVMAARFHAGLARAVVETVCHIAAESGLRTVALSGGCFQNRLLLAQTRRGLEAAGLEVLVHRQVPANDGGVSLGQAAIAASLETGT